MIRAVRIPTVAVDGACLLVAVAMLLGGCGSARTRATTAATTSTSGPGGLYVTVTLRDRATGQLEIGAVFSSKDGASGPGSASVIGLPCPHGRYVFRAEATELPSTPAGSYAADLTMGAARLPRGFVCGRQLPASIGTARLTVEILGTVQGHPANAFTIQGKRLADGVLEGAVLRVESTLCDGRYRFLATLLSGRRQFVLLYPFRLTNVTGTPIPPPCHK